MSDSERLKIDIDTILLQTFLKFAQMVLQSRFSYAPEDLRRRNTWFNLESVDSEHIQDQLAQWRRSGFGAPLTILILLEEGGAAAAAAASSSAPTKHYILESWGLSLSESQRQTASGSTSAAYKQVVLLFRALYTALRTLPTLKFMKNARKYEESAFTFTYKVLVGELSATVREKLQGMVKVEFAPVPSRLGTLIVDCFVSDEIPKLEQRLHPSLADFAVVEDYFPEDEQQRQQQRTQRAPAAGQQAQRARGGRTGATAIVIDESEARAASAQVPIREAQLQSAPLRDLVLSSGRTAPINIGSAPRSDYSGSFAESNSFVLQPSSMPMSLGISPPFIIGQQTHPSPPNFGVVDLATKMTPPFPESAMAVNAGEEARESVVSVHTEAKPWMTPVTAMKTLSAGADRFSSVARSLSAQYDAPRSPAGVFEDEEPPFAHQSDSSQRDSLLVQMSTQFRSPPTLDMLGQPYASVTVDAARRVVDDAQGIVEGMRREPWALLFEKSENLQRICRDTEQVIEALTKPLPSLFR